jgi:AMP-polyphosphate phosphotransferase
MLETIDLGKELDRETYKEWIPSLRSNLAIIQRRAFEAGLPVLIVFEGWDAAGKGDSIRNLVHDLDPRGFQVHKVAAPTDEERMWPFLWRAWNRTPARGQIAFFDGSWYNRVLRERKDGEVKRREWQQAYQEISRFERQVSDDGAVVVKLFLHISKKEQKKRFRQMEKSASESWRVTKDDWKHHKEYEQYLAITEEMLERTSTSWAPWTVVESTDRRYRRVKIFQVVTQAIQAGLERIESVKSDSKPASKKKPADEKPEGPELGKLPTVLDRADLTQSLEQDDYREKLDTLQDRLRELEFECYRHRLPVIVAYEGWDASGKGGNIKRVTGQLDPRGYDVIPIAAPTGDEATHHYLWRFWKSLPKAGHIAIFDRTWYGRVLVERVEGFIDAPTWSRAFQEINEFEQALDNFGTVLVKFWIHLSKDEQLRRFEERQAVEYKNYKITDDDWRNREKWDDYEEALVEVLERTSTTWAPWTIIEGDDKLWARVRALETIVAAIEKKLDAS